MGPVGRMTDDASDHRDPQLPPRGDRPKFAMDVDAGRYVNEGYACMSDNVKGGILELMPLEGAQVSHDKWNLIKSCRPRDLTYRSMNEAPWELTCIQMDLRHHIGRVAGTTYLDGRGGIRLVAATTVVGSISTIWNLLQSLTYNLGVPGSNMRVSRQSQMEELNHGTYTRREQRWFTQCDCWIRPWAVRAVSGHTIHDDPEKNLMELDPHKFAISPPLSPVNQLGGASHATSCRNLLSIVETGILPGASIDEGYNSRYEAGRLHSYYGVFALWDPKKGNETKSFRQRKPSDADGRALHPHCGWRNWKQSSSLTTLSSLLLCNSISTVKMHDMLVTVHFSWKIQKDRTCKDRITSGCSKCNIAQTMEAAAAAVPSTGTAGNDNLETLTVAEPEMEVEVPASAGELEPDDEIPEFEEFPEDVSNETLNPFS
eukprot:s1782_g7.t1